MDEAVLFKFGKWIDYSKSHPGVKIPPRKGCGLHHVTLFKICNPFNISGMDEATLIKFGKCVDCGKSHTRGKNSPDTGVVWVT